MTPILENHWVLLGTIHLGRRPFLGGEGSSKIVQIFRRIVVKNCQREGGRGSKIVKICRRLKWMVPYLFHFLFTNWNPKQLHKKAWVQLVLFAKTNEWNIPTFFWNKNFNHHPMVVQSLLTTTNCFRVWLMKSYEYLRIL